MAQLSGKVIEVFDVVSGETERGAWCRGGFAVMTNSDPQRIVAVTCFGERKCELAGQLRAGQSVMVDYYPESRKVGDRYFTEVHLSNLMVASRVEQEGGRNE